jgi:Ca2+-binding RTX toxin-like protein
LNEVRFEDRLQLFFYAKRFVLLPLVMITPILLSSSGWQFSSFLITNVAWAGSDNDNDDDNTPPLANGLPAKELCVKCENSKNVIHGEGLIVGTNHEDFIVGTDDILSVINNQIFGKDGPDIIFTGLGIDRVYGDAGGDTVQAGPGNDQIFGEGGDDHLFGGFDDDLIVGGSGRNHLFGDIGNDVLKGGENSGPNYFDCGDGFDTIIDFNLAKGDVTAGNCEIF